MASSNEKMDFLTGALVVQAPRSKSGIPSCQLPDGKFLSAISLTHGVANLCPQADALYPESNALLWDSLGSDFDEDAFTTRAAAWLGGAVRIPTESYDDMGPVGEDERWEAFDPFHDYLAQSFPLAHESLTLTKVNTYGLLYEWKGSDDSLKPLLLAAHQDVVPVEPETVDQWEYPPYSGYYDGIANLSGAGEAPMKERTDWNTVWSLPSRLPASIETLLEKGFEPARTIVLASGFDEEISGLQGAKHLSDAMLQKYGQDSFALLVDEGGLFSDMEGSVIAIASIAEKGKLDTGSESQLQVAIQASRLRTRSVCGQHAKNLPAHLRALIEASVYSDMHSSLEAELIKDPIYGALIGTTQAIDLVGRLNVYYQVFAVFIRVIHPWLTSSSVAAVQQRDTDVLRQLATEFNLTYTAFGSAISPEDGPTAGTLTLTDAFGTALEPAPVTPFGEDSAPWQLLSGTIKATYNAHRGLSGEDNIFVVNDFPTQFSQFTL
ncbi:hypothetical protein BJV77DRAFT_1070482 [Russula vinacea]|nr:hypothetical protein BJV77DRAFT_1070482 [Russula vinacea]